MAISKEQAELRKNGLLPWLKADAKAQVSFHYSDGQPVAIETVVLSTQHDAQIGLVDLRQEVEQHIIDAVIPPELRSQQFRTLINPTGRFVTGGPKGDTGLTGRKIIVDTYGGAAPHGGGAFSGKDPSKVDRSAAYMARFLAKQIVARGWSKRALVQLAYAIGVSEPVSFLIEADDISASRGQEITQSLQSEFDLTPAGIIKHLDLKRPLYYPTSAYGHFGRDDIHPSWELVK